LLKTKQGLHNPREYIACQGPLKTTINDHWQMIWEQNVTIIVMLTEVIERGMVSLYWYCIVLYRFFEVFTLIMDLQLCFEHVAAYQRYLLRLKIHHDSFQEYISNFTAMNIELYIRFIHSEDVTLINTKV
jgi:hypothetical protein